VPDFTFFLTHPSSSNLIRRSLIPEYFPSGEKVEDPEPTPESDGSDNSK
jgi:hypothetical protein